MSRPPVYFLSIFYYLKHGAGVGEKFSEWLSLYSVLHTQSTGFRHTRFCRGSARELCPPLFCMCQRSDVPHP